MRHPPSSLIVDVILVWVVIVIGIGIVKLIVIVALIVIVIVILIVMVREAFYRSRHALARPSLRGARFS